MQKVFMILLLVCFVQIGSAKNDSIPKTAFTKMYLPVWQEAVQHCLAIAEAMPEELYNYKPTSISKTFAEQMVHIAAANKLLTQRYVQGMEAKPNTPEASQMTKTEIITMIKNNFEYTTQVVIAIGQKQLDETCKMYHSGNIVSRAFALFYVQDHMANHGAKSNLYLRMNGIDPPEYTW